MNPAQIWVVIVTPSVLIGWLYHDYEDKISYLYCHRLLLRLVANGGRNPCHNYCSGGQSMGLEIHWSEEDKQS